MRNPPRQGSGLVDAAAESADFDGLAEDTGVGAKSYSPALNTAVFAPMPKARVSPARTIRRLNVLKF